MFSEVSVKSPGESVESVNRVYRVDGVNDDSRRLESGNLSKPATRQL